RESPSSTSGAAAWAPRAPSGRTRSTSSASAGATRRAGATWTSAAPGGSPAGLARRGRRSDLMAGMHRVVACLGAALLAAGSVAAQEPVPADSGFRAELLRMRVEDQDGRERVAQAAATGDTLFIKMLMARDSALTRRLQ